MDKYSGNYNSRCNTGKNYSDNCSGNYVRSRSENGNNAGYSRNRSGSDNDGCQVEFHLHEVQGSVQVAGGECEAHNHRFATISSEPIALKNGDHTHQVTFRTDSYEGHCHEFTGRMTDEFEICEGHVHYLDGKTSEAAGHRHSFRVITHIENPTED